MEENQNAVLELAGRLYDLDAEVYRVLGSGLGRVFNLSREEAVRELTGIMRENQSFHYLRSELALIGNMARTIRSREERSRVMREYNAILALVKQLPACFGTVDILDQAMAELNQSCPRNNLAERFSHGQHLVICIGRTYGSGGTDIGFALADQLRINFYDTEIFMEVLERLEAQRDHICDRASFSYKQDLNQTPMAVRRPRGWREMVREFSRYHGLPKVEAVFFNQTDLICHMAKREDFIIMGRCADVILTNHRIPHVSIFINAPWEARVRKVMEEHGLDERGANRLLKTLDRRHSRYYHYFTGRTWGNSVNYDLCINSASYGIQGAVELIQRVLRREGSRAGSEREGVNTDAHSPSR